MCLVKKFLSVTWPARRKTASCRWNAFRFSFSSLKSRDFTYFCNCTNSDRQNHIPDKSYSSDSVAPGRGQLFQRGRHLSRGVFYPDPTYQKLFDLESILLSLSRDGIISKAECWYLEPLRGSSARGKSYYESNAIIAWVKLAIELSSSASASKKKSAFRFLTTDQIQVEYLLMMGLRCWAMVGDNLALWKWLRS